MNPKNITLVTILAAVLCLAGCMATDKEDSSTNEKTSSAAVESASESSEDSSETDTISSFAEKSISESSDASEDFESQTYYVNISKIPEENDPIPITDQAKIDEIEAWVERAMSDSETVYLKEGDFPQYGGGGTNFYTIKTTESVKDKIYFVDKADIDPSSYLDNNSQPYKYINNFTIAVDMDKTYMQISREKIKELDDILADVISISD